MLHNKESKTFLLKQKDKSVKEKQHSTDKDAASSPQGRLC